MNTATTDAPARSANATAVAAIYDAFGRGDVPAILDRIADHAVWESGVRDTGIPYLRARRGKQEIAEFFGDLAGNLELTHFRPEAICDGGDIVMVPLEHAGRITGGGEIPMTQEAHEWRFGEDGRVVSFRHLFDYAVHEAAMAVRAEQYAGRELHAVSDVIEVVHAGGQFELFRLSGPRDSGPPPHAHPWDEGYIVIDGEVEVHDGDDVRVLGAGDRTVLPAGRVHSYRIVSESATFHVITGGHRASAFFADLDANADPGMPTPETLPGIIAVARRNGLTSPLFD